MFDNVEQMKIGVVGAGSWGTALANILALKEYAVDIWVYDINGRLVKQIDAGNRKPGLHQVDIGQLSAGVYFCRMKTEQAEIIKKFVVVN